MLAVGLSSNEVQKYIKDQPDVVIGCNNSPQSVTLSGGKKTIEEVRSSLVEAGVFTRRVNSEYPSLLYLVEIEC